ncbi:MAG: mobile mystery protein A [Azospirillum brasilense]|nr:MAG: mobile mystery protein A [Azospirillum brasilense]
MIGMKQLQIEMLDRHLAELKLCEQPSKGWIAAIRKALGMNTRQFGARMRSAQQSAAQLEQNEINGSITLKSLRKAAEALDCRVAYVLIPNEGSLEATIKKQARKKAAELVTPVDQSMRLEAQEVGNLREQIETLALEMAKNPNSKLWE